MNDEEFRLECVRIASENLKSTGGCYEAVPLISYANKLFDYIRQGQIPLEVMDAVHE